MNCNALTARIAEISAIEHIMESSRRLKSILEQQRKDKENNVFPKRPFFEKLQIF